MEHNTGGLVQIIFLSKWVICRFQPFIFQGVIFGNMANNNGGCEFCQHDSGGRKAKIGNGRWLIGGNGL